MSSKGKNISHNSQVIFCLKDSTNNSTLNDVQILVGEEKKVFYASSFLLGSRSPIFKAMFFTSGLKEQQTKQLELKDTNSDSFLSFLKYVNIGEIAITEEVINN